MEAELNETFTYKGFTFVERHYADLGHDAPDTPWAGNEQLVSDWITEFEVGLDRLLVCSSGKAGKYYDIGKSRKLAIASGMTGDEAEQAVQADFKSIRGWYQDEWHYIGIQVSLQQLPSETEGLWGIESTGTEYHHQTRQELAEQLLRTLPKWIDREIEKLEKLKRQLEADAYRDADEIIRDRHERER